MYLGKIARQFRTRGFARGEFRDIYLFSDGYDGFSNHRGTDGVDDLPFVTGVIWQRPRDVMVQMRAREPRKSRPPPGSGGGKSLNAAARKWTSQMKEAKSCTELLDVVNRVLDGPLDGATFDYFHASAAYHGLVTCKRKGGLTPSEKASPVLLRLAARVQAMTEEGQVGPQAVANVLYSLGKLSDDLEVPEGLLKALAAQISKKANGMKPQELSNSLWAATRLKDSTPEVLQMVPALLEEIPRNQADFKSQEICNCLEALVLLQDSVPAVDSFLAAAPGNKHDFVGFTASRFSALLPTLKGKKLALEMPVVVWACAKVNFNHQELLVSVAQHGKSDGTLQGLTDWSLCAMLWSYDVLDPDGRFAQFKNALESERVRRGLSDSDVSKSQSGYLDWNQAKG